jgi:hypothetical protein
MLSEPLPVIGPPVSPVPLPTLVTVPPPPGLIHDNTPDPFVDKTWPELPASTGKVRDKFEVAPDLNFVQNVFAGFQI